LVVFAGLDIRIFPRAQSGDHFVPEDAGFFLNKSYGS
jgi:hypothetical protein